MNHKRTVVLEKWYDPSVAMWCRLRYDAVIDAIGVEVTSDRRTWTLALFWDDRLEAMP